MQVNANREDFSPVTLTFVLETQKEVDAMFCLFNHVVLTEFQRQNNLKPVEVRDALCKYVRQVDGLFGILSESIREYK